MRQQARRLSCAAVWMMTAVAAAQVGPPACAAVPASGSRPTVETARKAQEAGAADASMMVAADPVENFSVSRYRLADYGDCTGNVGCYWKDVAAQAIRARLALEAGVAGHVSSGKKKQTEKLAMVLDVDDTTLSSYCEMKREDFGYIPEMYAAWMVTPEAAVPIPGMLELFQEARKLGVAVFFLAGRPEDQRAATERNLRAVGFNGWQGVILRNADERSMPTQAYKSAERARLTAAGYKIVLNVGDQWSDLMGSPKAEISVKLPNPFYFLP